MWDKEKLHVISDFSFPSVMALDYCQNFVSAQYLENELMEEDQILHYALTLTRSRLGLLGVNFCKYTTQLWPLVIVKMFVSGQYFVDESMELDQIVLNFMH